MNPHDNPVMPQPFEIINVTHETELEYTFRIASDLPCAPGQFFQLSVPRIGECPISSSNFGDGFLDFTLRAVGKVTDHFFTLGPGDTIFLRGPYGNGWPLDKIKDKHLVVVTGGTGLSPVRGLLNKCFDEEGFVKSVHLIAGFKNLSSILFKSDLQRWPDKFDTTYTLYNEDAEGWNRGMVTLFLDNVPFESFGEDYAVIMVGSPRIMNLISDKLSALNIPDEKIWVSLERKMSCGVGKCGHCRIGDMYVCIDGPVFNYTKVKNLLD